jgi:hypothetical protein
MTWKATRAPRPTGDRKPKLTTKQAEHAPRLYDAKQHTVAEIVGLPKVPRKTILICDAPTSGRRDSFPASGRHPPRSR